MMNMHMVSLDMLHGQEQLQLERCIISYTLHKQPGDSVAHHASMTMLLVLFFI
jgi:hypothetical protein